MKCVGKPELGKSKRHLVVDTGGIHRFSPCIVATTLLVWRAARNSSIQMPCHVPRAWCLVSARALVRERSSLTSFPSLIGTVTEAPMRALLTCACAEPPNQQLRRDHAEHGASGWDKNTLAYHLGPRRSEDTDPRPWGRLPERCGPERCSCLSVRRSPSSR